MKKVIKTMMMMLVASTLVLTSCKDDETTIEDVKLTLNPAATSGTYGVGTILKIVVNGKGNSDNKLTMLTITKAPKGSPTTTLASEKLSGTDKIYDLIDTLKAEGEITYTIKLEGAKGTAQTATFVATVVNVNPIEVLPADNLSLKGQTQEGAQHFMQMDQNFSPYSTDLSKAEWSNNVDLAYFYGTENKHTITSPDNATMQGLFTGLKDGGYFTSSRKTGFYKISATEGGTLYNKIVSDNDDAALTSFASGKVYTDFLPNLAPNDVILYKTQGGLLGLIKIGNASGVSASNANLPFQALVQVK
ncbi:MAG: hypothetical protein V4658_08270 [Bacteroidota bacterium]